VAIESLILGFGYRSRSGKDTAVAEIIKQRKGQYDVRRYAFADELKREVNACLDAFPPGQRHWQYLWDRNYMLVREDGEFVCLLDYPWVQYDPDAPMDDPFCPYGKQRTLLQWWGTEFRRNINPDYWVKKLTKRIEKEKPEIACITDMRFPNEFTFAKEHGEVFRVDRPDLPPLTSKSHYSESALANVPDEEWTRILKNDRSLEEFQALAVDAFDTVMELEPRGYGI
jgi:hypothetical protein